MHIGTKYLKNEYGFLEKILFPFSKKIKIPNLKQKTILVTGASFGIGESLVRILAQDNCHFILMARTSEALIRLKTHIEHHGGSAEIHAFDLRNSEERKQVISALKEQRIDVFIHNAGHSIYRKITDSFDRFHDVERLIQLHYHAPIEMILSLLPTLISHQSQIINISAINILLPSAAGWSAYQSSKAAFDQWFQSVSVELRKQGVTMTTIYLPLVKTRMSEPNESYNRFPKMSADHVSKIICQSIIKKFRTHVPWWMPLIRWTSLVPRNLTEKIFIQLDKK